MHPDKSHLGLVQIFWGNGKGKTTAALGTALRACGNGYYVHLVQFMKNGLGNPLLDDPGEVKSLKVFPNFSYRRFGTGSWIIGHPSAEQLAKVQEAYNYLISCFGRYDILIADEILYAVQLGLLSEADVIKLIEQKPQNQELILTGSHKPFENIFAIADLVTEVKKHKHPFDKGILAREGIEY